MIRVCYYCEELKEQRNLLVNFRDKNKHHNFALCSFLPCSVCSSMDKFKKRIEKLEKHSCTCNTTEKEVSAKGMEPLGNCRLCTNAPKHGIKVRGICMDDNTTSKAQLRKDTGPDSTGCMEAELEVLDFYADPSHRKKCYNKGLYKMSLSSPQCKRLGKYFATWVSQTKHLPLADMRASKMVPVMHACGNHKLYGSGDYER